MKHDLPIGMIDQPPEVIQRYRKMIASGESPRLAEMFAVRRAPRLETATSDAAELKVSNVIKNHGLPYVQKMREQAKKAGIQLTDDSFFNPSMADERQGADPEAWLHPGDGSDKFKRTVRKRGGACESLGVDFGESQERVDKAQAGIEKQRKINQERQVIRRQKAREKSTQGAQ